jgi:hypothetical protein
VQLSSQCNFDECYQYQVPMQMWQA